MKDVNKKWNKRMIVGLLVFVLVFGMPAYPLSANDMAAVSVQDTSANMGATVTVPINLTNVTDICAADIWLSYDNRVVNVTAVSDGNLGGIFGITCGIDNANNVTRMNWFTITGKTGDFIFAYVTLKAVGDPGETSPLNLMVKEIADSQAVPIAHTVIDGTFTVVGDETGSISGKITYTCNSTGIADATVDLTQGGSIIDTTTTDGNGDYSFPDVTVGDYDVNASKAGFWDNSSGTTVNSSEMSTVDMMLWLKGDLNNNGRVDGGDAAKIANYFVGNIPEL